MAIVKPQVHSSAPPCFCESWLQHWKNASGQSIFFCPVINCLEKELEGVKVTITKKQGEKLYVIPLCTRHAKSEKELHISDAYKLIPPGHEADCIENLPMTQKTVSKTKIHAE